MLNNRRVASLAFAVLLPAILLGCGSDRDPSWPETYPVSGMVTLDGEPVEKAIVTFLATNGTRFAPRAVSDEQGRYTLITGFTPSYDERGAPAGDYKILVFTPPEQATAATQSNPSAEPGADAGPIFPTAADSLPAVSATPVIYEAESTTPLQYTVTEEGGEFNIEMMSQQ